MASFMLAIFINQADVSALTVISVRAVLAQVVLVEKLLLHSSGSGSYRQRMVVTQPPPGLRNYAPLRARPCPR